MLHESIVKAINIAFGNISSIKQKMNQICNTVLDEDREQKKVERMEDRIKSKMEEMMNLVKLGARDAESDRFNQKFLELNDEIMRLRNEKEEIRVAGEREQAKGRELQGLYQYISTMECEVRQYDETMVRRTIQEIEVVSPSELKVVIKGGMEVPVPIRMMDGRKKEAKKKELSR